MATNFPVISLTYNHKDSNSSLVVGYKLNL